MNPFLIGVSRSTDHLCRRRIPRVVSETRNLLKIGGDHLDANPIRLGGGPLVCETVLIGEGDAIDANSIRFKGGDSMKESHFPFR